MSVVFGRESSAETAFFSAAKRALLPAGLREAGISSRREASRKIFLTSPVILSVSEESMRSFTFVQDDDRCFAALKMIICGRAAHTPTNPSPLWRGERRLASRGEVFRG